MKVQNIKIISCPGLWIDGAEPDAEIEQQLTISATGRVWFKSTINGEDYKGEVRERTQVSIGKETAKDILEAVDDYFNNLFIERLAFDVGVWTLIINYTDGSKQKFHGSMVDGYENDEADELNRYIRENIPIKELLLFDGKESD